MKTRRRLLLALLAATLLGASGCQTGIGMGVDVGIHDGKVNVRPRASVDFYGSPR